MMAASSMRLVWTGRARISAEMLACLGVADPRLFCKARALLVLGRLLKVAIHNLLPKARGFRRHVRLLGDE